MLELRRVDQTMPSDDAIARMRKRAAASQAGAGVEGSGTSMVRRATSSAHHGGASGIEAEETGDSQKRARGNGGASKMNDRRPRDAHDDDGGRGKGLIVKLTSASGDEVRHVVAPSPKRSQSVKIEIGPHERWTVMEKEPFQAFEAFNLRQDADYYDSVAREDQVLRCKRRIGRVVSDMFRFAESYVGGSDEATRVALQRDLDTSRKSIVVLEHNQKKVELEARRFEEQVAKAQEEMNTLRLAVKEKDGQLVEVSKNLEEREAMWVNEKSVLEREVDVSLEDGFGICWNMATDAGVDMFAFSFEEYLKSLNEGGGSGPV